MTQAATESGATVVAGNQEPVAAAPADRAPQQQFRYAHEAIAWHFDGIPPDQLIAVSRKFPGHMRADLQVAIDRLFSVSPVRFFGIHEPYRYETVSFASLTQQGKNADTIAPAQYVEVDIGEDMPVRCLHNGLWLCRDGDLPYAAVLSMHREFREESGACVEIAIPAGEAASVFAQKCFSHLEAAIKAARSYRGKVLSLEADVDYNGRSRGVTVHRLPPVARGEVILPAGTMKLLDRNVFRFIENRDRLRRLGQSTRKGILLYGPPGTGKTHTIRYLASNLPDHTTLIITAGQIGLLAIYMNLARLLQPTMVVIEDVDVIGRDRNAMNGPCEESLLNRLLNEMDGLKEDADVLFVLTTNRPEQLEAALTSRPGRIDQAIEVGLPDAASREKLVRLYAKGLELDNGHVADVVARTKGTSGAFIKELMRRIAQATIERDGGRTANGADIAEALDDMLFTGGNLNARLLGVAGP